MLVAEKLCGQSVTNYKAAGFERKVKVAFVVPTIAYGGAERVAATLLSHLDRNAFQITLILYENKFTYDIPEDVDIICFNLNSSKNPVIRFLNAVRKIYRLNKIFRNQKFDVIVSFMIYTNLLAVISLMVSSVRSKIILTEHNKASVQNKYAFGGNIINWLLRRLYPRADCIVGVSSDIADDLAGNYSIPMNKIVRIYNPIDNDAVMEQSCEKLDDLWLDGRFPVLIHVGRIHLQKDHATLLKAFKKIQKQYDSARLMLLGLGERTEVDRLIKRIKDLELVDHVKYYGFQANPFKFMRKADVLVLSSRWEGLPMVLIEGMALGLPVVSTDCPSGPSEIIQNGINGLLVPVANSEALADAILTILRDGNLREAMSQNAKTTAKRFSAGSIVKEYESVFLKVAGA